MVRKKARVKLVDADVVEAQKRHDVITRTAVGGRIHHPLQTGTPQSVNSVASLRQFSYFYNPSLKRLNIFKKYKLHPINTFKTFYGLLD